MLKKKYYTIEEAIMMLGKYGLTIGMIGSYTREKLIHPIIYINSKPAHACESSIDNNNAIAVGHCYISAYWDLGAEMTGIVDNLISSDDGTIKVRNLIKKELLIGEPEIFSWQYDESVFDRVPHGHVHPKPFSSDLKIKYFILRSPNNYTVILKFSNILLSHSDIELLRHRIMENDLELPKQSETENHNNNQEALKSDKKKIWENVFSELHQISGLMQKGNKMQLVDSAISKILNAVKKIHPNFDPMIMPGTVENFHEFCLSMPRGSEIFPDNKMSFGKYCKRTLEKSKQKLPPLCAWKNPSIPNKQFWMVHV